MDKFYIEYKNIKIFLAFPGNFFFTKTYGRPNQFTTLGRMKSFIDNKLAKEAIKEY